MKTHVRMSRRSFLGQVCGGLAVTGGALAAFAPAAKAGQVTDHDPTDPVGRGRGGGSGITDRDSGAGADPAGRGRGGTLPQSSGVTDSDRGVGADPIGQGRGGGGRPVTGITDSDGGQYADPPQRGRGGRPRSNIEMSEEERRERCDNNRRRIAELEQQTYVPDGWSDAQVAQAQADLAAVRAAASTIHGGVTGETIDRGWAVVGPIAARYRIPASRSTSWSIVSAALDEMIWRARRYGAQRRELHRQIDQHRTNLTALGC